MVQELTGLNQCATICVRIGNSFDFEFSNHGGLTSCSKKLSPSQIKRNQVRKREYEMSKIMKEEHRQPDKVVKLEEVETKAEVMKQDKASQADVIFFNEIETQTELILGVDVAVNTDKEVFDKLDSILHIEKDGSIRPRSENEKIVEIRVSYNVKSWDGINLIIKNLKM